jgi:hypothetical protein
MKRAKKVLKLIFLSITVSLILGLFFSKFISYEKRINANFLVVEGWVPQAELQKAVIEFQNHNYEYLLTTGGPLNKKLALITNGFLVFRFKEPGEDLFSSFNITEFLIKAKSSLGRKDPAHFAFWINDQVFGDFYTTEFKGHLLVEWGDKITRIDSLMIQFKNDYYEGKIDRNLLIDGVFVNRTELNSDNSEIFLDRGQPFGDHRINLTAKNHAELCANYLVSSGIPEEKIITISNDNKSRKTYSNALALRNWIESNKPQEKINLNIVTTEFHSRRTFITYKKTLKDLAQVGVIPVKEGHEGIRKRELIISRIKETGALMYYLIFVIPFI